MRDRKFMQSLTQAHIGSPEYTDKSKARIRKAWKEASKLQREAILYLCGTSVSSVHRAYIKGRVTAKIISAMAQELRIDPVYLLGKSDTQRDYTDGILTRFLEELGYEIKDGYAKKKKRNLSRKPSVIKQKPESVWGFGKSGINLPEGLHDAEALCAVVNGIIDTEALDKLESLTLEDMDILLRGIIIQAAISPGKRTRLNAIKYLLSS